MEPVEIAEYDPQWPELYAQEAAEARQAFGASLVALEHIGSTSVPGLAAKPIVDVQAVVRSLGEINAVTPKLTALGWQQGVFALDPERRLYFKKYNAAGARTYQLHIYEPSHPAASAHLLFRNYLWAHPEEVRRYEALKRGLAGRFRFDRLAYNAAKTEYIEAVVTKAREQAHG